MPPGTADCLKECQVAVNKVDGCAENDFACHCVKYNAYSDVRLSFLLLTQSPTIFLNPTENTHHPHEPDPVE